MGPNEQLRPRHNGSNDITNTTPNSTQAVEGNQRANGQWQHVRRRRNRNQNRECLQNTNIIQQKESAAALVDVNEDTVQGENGNNAGAERVLNTTAEPITEGSNAGAERVLNTAAEPVTEGRNNEVVLENLANIAEVHNDPEVSERCLELVGAADVGAGPRNSPLSAQQHSQSQVNTLTFVQSDTLLTRPSTLSTESIPGTGMSGVVNNQLQLMDQSIAFAGGIGINVAIVNDESGHRLNETPTDHQEMGN